MTALVGGHRDVTQKHALPPPPRLGTPAADVPVLAPGTVLLGAQQGSGYVVPPSLVRRSDGQVLQLTPLIYAVLEAIDGIRDVGDVARAATDVCGRTLAADDVTTLLDGRLRPLGLVLAPDGTRAAVSRANPLLALRPKFVVSKPEWTRRLTAPFALLFSPLLVIALTAAFAAVAFWVLFDKGLASAAYEAFSRPGLLLAVFAITVVSAGFHEFGHAAALRRGGGTPGAMGAGLYLIWPAFYTDVTDSYRLSRAARIRVDLGGLYFNAIVALVMFGIWSAVRWDGLLLVIAAQILQMIRQLPPLVRFDGYHLLADVTGVPDLFHRIGPTLRSFLPRRWRHSQSRALRPWVRVVVTTWVLLVVPLLLASAAVTVIAMPRIIGTSWHSMTVQANLLDARAHDGDVWGAAVKALAIVALVVPVGGLFFMIVRAVRSYGIRLWRATSGKPAQRGVAGVLVAGMLVGLGFAWWPHGNYRPIQPWERGTIQDAVPATFTGLHAGVQRSATTIWAADGAPLPTREHPAVALVLTPRSGSGPTWVFPFNRPTPPGPGDNQAMAIVTKDGGTAYDVAFALVWVNKDIALNRNEAYAFASCQTCKAVAIAFQVVLVVGEAHVVAPQNIAAAVSYHCFACVTQALAVQLVVTVPQKLSADAMRRLAVVWAKVAALQHNLRSMTFAQIQQAITSVELQILAIVRPASTTIPTTPGPSAPTASTTGTTATDAPATTAPTTNGAAVTPSSDGGQPTSSANTSSSPAPSPSEPASTTPASSPTPTPTSSTTSSQ